MSNSSRPPPSRPPSSATVLVVIGVAIGVLIGWVGGGVGPRRELAAARAELDRARDELVKAQRGAARRGFGGDLLPGIGALLGGAEGGAAPLTPGGGPGAAPKPDPSGVAVEVGSGPAPQAPGGQGAPAGEPSAAELITGFNQAAELQAVRAAQARAALTEQAALNAEEQAEVEAVVSRLEAKLADHADELIDLAMDTDEPPTAEALRLTHEVTGALYEAQAGLEDLVGVDRLEELDPEALQVWNLIELDGMRPAVERAAAELAAGGAR